MTASTLVTGWEAAAIMMKENCHMFVGERRYRMVGAELQHFYHNEWRPSDLQVSSLISMRWSRAESSSLESRGL